ncbi:MAG: flagellar hook-basal body complex protein FliE [Phycisphaerales bacterium]
MTDPVGLIGNSGALNRELPQMPNLAPPKAAGSSFADMLQDQLNTVNQLQRDAKEAIEDMMAGRRVDVESVMIATEKADLAFRLLLQVRNKVMAAYDELKQIRV